MTSWIHCETFGTEGGVSGAKEASGRKPLGIGPTDFDLDRVNAKLTQIVRLTGLDEYDQCGQLILDVFFDGSVTAWKSRSPAKEASIRRLARRPNAPYRKDALTKRVGVHVTLRAHPFLRECSRVSASHIVEVLRLDADSQAEMLKKAQERSWSVTKLREAVVVLRRAKGERRGRHPATVAVRALAVAQRMTNQCGELSRLVADLTEGGRSDPKSLQELDGALRELASNVVGVLETLRTLPHVPALAKAREPGVEPARMTAS